jgi:gamma-glutamylcyclotransferase (GGCT)/AIG2-like uncharacterized protein YtfP
VVLGRGQIRGRLYDMGTHPAGVYDSGSSYVIKGRIVEFPDDESIIRELDRYEGCEPASPETSFFTRQIVPVKVLDGRELPCWVYTYPGDISRRPRILDGDYARWIASGDRAQI